MRYEGAIYRPPSEASSLIIQATIGCSHNQCTFCSMYKDKKFKIRNTKEILEDLESAKESGYNPGRIFLADGNALALKTKDLKVILEQINKLFPGCERVGIYSGPKDILNKSLTELKELRKLGLKIAYLGVESGSDKILKDIKKGVTSSEMIKAGKRMAASGIDLSITLISGLGGKENWRLHAQKSARVINEIDPPYLALLTLLTEPGTELYQDIQRGEFKLLSPQEVAVETRELIADLKLSNCIFRSNHASNYLALKGTLPEDKERLLKELDTAIESKDFKDESFRKL